LDNIRAGFPQGNWAGRLFCPWQIYIVSPADICVLYAPDLLAITGRKSEYVYYRQGNQKRKRRTQTMKINDAMRTYRLPNPTTPEDLECRWSKLLTFGDRVVIAGYFFNGPNKPCYFGAAYEFLGDDHTCEGAIGLRAASGAEFEDDGHAIVWAMQQ
jgi:hypothetical protein